jgi:hypothetical protein
VKNRNRFAHLALLAAFTLVVACCAAQENALTPAKPPMSAAARLLQAKTVYVDNVDGNSIGADTITSTLEGWGRYQVIDDPKKADLLIEVTSPDDSGGMSVSSSTSGPTRTGGVYGESRSSSRDISSGSGRMRLVVRDARTKVTLWAASEQVKGGLKKNARENNLVEAAQKLVSKFHDRVQPADGNSNTTQ